VTVGGAEAEAAFLVDLLGYQRVQLKPGDPPTAKWFESADGKQIHLSEDPDHRPAARAHVAVDLGDDLALLVRRFEDAGYPYERRPGNPTVYCRDPGGNRWELRGTS
jgi:catechol 2,3-dioxygenase-like lactoylglutathione lyase family enzyme